MPIPLRPKSRAKAEDARGENAIESIDWLGVWALSLGFCAVNLAGVAYFINRDNIGATFILAGAAALMAVIVRFGRHKKTDAN
jgi:hypothetical protein